MRTMSAVDLIEQHLSYGPGGNAATDREVFRRWPALERRYGALLHMQQQHWDALHAAGPVDLDELPPPTPGYAEALEEYRQEARRLAREKS